MENNLISLVSPKPVLGFIPSPNPTSLSTKQCFGLPLLPRKPIGSALFSRPRSKNAIFSLSNSNSHRTAAQNHNDEKKSNGVELFASISRSDRGQETSSSVGVNPQPYAPPPSQVGSPLFWIGVGVGLSSLCVFVSSKLKNFVMRQAFQNLMGSSQSGNSAFSPGSPFGFPPSPTSGRSAPSGYPFQSPSMAGPSSLPGLPYQIPTTSGTSFASGSAAFSGPAQAASRVDSEAAVGADLSATKVQDVEPETVKDESEIKTEVKKPAFVDVSPEDTFQKSPFEDYNDSSPRVISPSEVVQNGAAYKEATSANEDTTSGNRRSLLSVEALEKLMEDPNVQKMVYPQLPEEMRNPETFKWMLQNPQYRQQLQDMLDNMAGSPGLDNSLNDTLQNFDLNSPQVRQQFEQLGVTPEEMISRVMANPDIAMAFGNPKVQQALMDISQNPFNITKYQSDPEIMSVFLKLQQLFPEGGPGGF